MEGIIERFSDFHVVPSYETNDVRLAVNAMDYLLQCDENEEQEREKARRVEMEKATKEAEQEESEGESLHDFTSGRPSRAADQDTRILRKRLGPVVKGRELQGRETTPKVKGKGRERADDTTEEPQTSARTAKQPPPQIVGREKVSVSFSTSWNNYHLRENRKCVSVA